MNLLQRFLQICLFKAGPADVPASNWLMKLTLLFLLIVSTIVNHVDNDWSLSLLLGLADIMLMMVICWLLLQWRGFKHRYLQTVTATAGVHIILHIILFPVVILYPQAENQEQILSLVLLLLILVLFWLIAVTAHIFRQALEISTGKAVLIAIAYVVISFFVVELINLGAE